MTEEKELILPARAVEAPTVEELTPAERPRKLDVERSGIQPSKIPEPIQLSPSAGYDPLTDSVISEQELIERAERQREIDERCREIETRRKRWAGKTEEEILLSEVELVRRGTLNDPTWSFYRTEDGYQAHLYGVTESVTPNQLAYTRRSATWHQLARGIIQRLRRKRTRQMDIEQTPRPEVYEEQARLLSEVLRVLGAAGEAAVAEAKRRTVGIREPSTRWKTVVHHLGEFLKQVITETGACRTEAKAAAAAAESPAFQSEDPSDASLLKAENAELRRRLEAIEMLLHRGRE